MSLADWQPVKGAHFRSRAHSATGKRDADLDAGFAQISFYPTNQGRAIAVG
jgi:hypothetical protein